MTRKSSKLFQN